METNSKERNRLKCECLFCSHHIYLRPCSLLMLWVKSDIQDGNCSGHALWPAQKLWDCLWCGTLYRLLASQARRHWTRHWKNITEQPFGKPELSKKTKTLTSYSGVQFKRERLIQMRVPILPPSFLWCPSFLVEGKRLAGSSWMDSNGKFLFE